MIAFAIAAYALSVRTGRRWYCNTWLEIRQVFFGNNFNSVSAI